MVYRQYLLVALAAAIFAAGCNTSQVSLPPPGSSHSAMPAVTHMYLSINSTTGSVQIYTVPVTSASVATGAIIGLNEPEELFVDKTGRLFVPILGSASNTVQVYTTPATSASTPAFTLTTLSTHPEETAEDSSGNVYVAVTNSSTCCIEIFPGPVSSSVTASSEVTANGVSPNGLGFPFGMGFDSSNNLYVSSTTSIIQYTQPISSTSTPAQNVTPNFDNFGLAVDSSNNIYVANATSDGTIDVFHQPFVSGTGTRAFGITVAGTFLAGMAFDGSGNLWTVDSAGNVYEIAAPITSASTATKIITVAGAYGIAFGP